MQYKANLIEHKWPKTHKSFDARLIPNYLQQKALERFQKGKLADF